MFQRNIDKILKELPNVFDIEDYILVVGYYRNGVDHDNTLYRVPEICRQENLNLTKINVISGGHHFPTWVKYF